MLLNIRHATSYTYDHPVILGPHCLRLTPRSDSYALMLERALNITPEPVNISQSVESDGSISHWLRFNGETKIFTVESKLVISILENKNPFDFLVFPEACLTLPMRYPLDMARELQTYLMAENIAPSVRGFAFDVLAEVKGQAMDFLVALTTRMKRDFIYEFRQDGAPHRPQDTLASRRGSCRDWAILYMACAKAVGLAARFVSGYYFDEDPKFPDLHAWAEVYIPGGGWRGFDPSLGLACYEHHIALASGVAASAAAPVQGAFKGNARATMKLELEYKYSSMN